MWDLPRPGLEPTSPALAGRLLTTAPPGKPPIQVFWCQCWFSLRLLLIDFCSDKLWFSVSASLSSLGGGGVPCDLTFLKDLEKLLIFQFVKLFTCCWNGPATSKILTSWIGNQKSPILFNFHDENPRRLVLLFSRGNKRCFESCPTSWGQWSQNLNQYNLTLGWLQSRSSLSENNAYLLDTQCSVQLLKLSSGEDFSAFFIHAF